MAASRRARNRENRLQRREAIEFTEVIGIRRSIRFFDPDRPVEREKIQKILEAMRLGSCAMNAHWLRAVLVYRDELPPETFEAAAGRGIEARRRRSHVVSFLSHNGAVIY